MLCEAPAAVGPQHRSDVNQILDSVQNLALAWVMDDDVKQLLRQHGLQVTAQRLATMRAVSSHPHATADELTEDVRTAIGAISRQAVYDTLAVLADKRLVRRIQTPGSPARYEDRVGDNHHHLICRGCGAVSDIDCAVGAAPCLTASDAHGFEIDEAEVIYWGRCASCRELAPAMDAVKIAPQTGPPGGPAKLARPRKNQRDDH